MKWRVPGGGHRRAVGFLFTKGELSAVYIHLNSEMQPLWPDAILTIEGGKFHGYIGHEGVPTVDGREWVPGAVGLSRLPVPLLAAGRTTLGHVELVTRPTDHTGLFALGFINGAMPDGDYPCGMEVTNAATLLVYDDGTREVLGQ